MYQLNTRILKDSDFITNLKLSELRLLKDGELDWFILIPRIPNVIEWTDLSLENQTELIREINLISTLLEDFSSFKKLNIATIGNIVSQFHLHIIARQEDDRAWPNTIWGTNSSKDFDCSRSDFWKSKFT